MLLLLTDMVVLVVIINSSTFALPSCGILRIVAANPECSARSLSMLGEFTDYRKLLLMRYCNHVEKGKKD